MNELSKPLESAAMFTVTFADSAEHAADPCRHATTARKRALGAARDSGRQVTVKRGDREAYVVTPAGHILAPSGVETDDRENCKRALGTDGPCFCTACRAERRERRKL